MGVINMARLIRCNMIYKAWDQAVSSDTTTLTRKYNELLAQRLEDQMRPNLEKFWTELMVYGSAVWPV